MVFSAASHIVLSWLQSLEATPLVVSRAAASPPFDPPLLSCPAPPVPPYLLSTISFCLQDSHRQRTVNWCDSTGGTSAAFDFTTKGILQVGR
jgi:hypothetical protein